MGAIFRYIFFFIVFFEVFNYIFDNNASLFDLLKPRDRQENYITFNPRVKNINTEEPNIPIQEVPQQKTNKNNETIIIKPLGDVDYDDLTDAAKIIQEFYGFNTVIEPGIPIDEDMYIKNTREILNADICIEKLFTYQKTLYIVDKKLWANGSDLRGYAYMNAGTIIVRGEKSFLRETVIHEIGHTLGLDHCSDLTCIMATSNDEYDSGNFCNKCKSKLNIYE